ncbi:MAG: type II toxin-antitoxin system RelE/ParE family toxin [Rhodocyclaceae bacterium]|nr:type II toxin-antitoxin system RelE/ParE family toxin [Rhodocyclaceae bacterium]
MAEYRLTPAAERDLESIWTFTAGQWGLEQVHRHLDLLLDAMVKLAEAPTWRPAASTFGRATVAGASSGM